MSHFWLNYIAAFLIVVGVLMIATAIAEWWQYRERVWLIAAAVAVLLLLLLSAAWQAHARDLDGRYTNSPLHDWFQGLYTEGGGRCCDEADGTGIEPIDWDIKNGHYRVRLDGEWQEVPDNKVITEPNKLGKAVVWTYRGPNGLIIIRCFMAGQLS